MFQIASAFSFTASRSLLPAVVAASAAALPAQWQPGSFQGGMDNVVNALAAASPTDLVAAGSFTLAGTTAATGVARWDGSNWQPLGAGVTAVVSMFRRPGEIVVGTGFGTVSRFNGTSWTTLPGAAGGLSTFAGSVLAVADGRNGDIVAGGFSQFSGGIFRPALQVFTGGVWTSPSNVSGLVRRLAPLGNGDVAVGGLFSFGTGTTSLARFVPGVGMTAFASVSSPAGRVEAIRELANRDVVIGLNLGGGNFEMHRFRSGVWTRVARCDGRINDFTELPDGDLVVAGEFTTIGGVVAPTVARLSGNVFAPLASAANGGASAVAWLDDGQLVAGGTFTAIGVVAAGFIAPLLTPTPAVAALFGSPCGASAGVLLGVANQPWIGAPLITQVTGLPPNTASVLAWGATLPGVSLPTPPFAANCVLSSSAEALETLVPTGGAATSIFLIPDDPTLLGMAWFQQVASLDGAGVISLSVGQVLVFGDF